MQPRNPSSFSDPLPNPSREPPGLTKLPPRALAPIAPTPVRPPEPIRLIPTIKFYHRMRPGKLYPLVVQLQSERGSGPVAPGAFSGSAVRTTLAIQPVIPGATVSPVSIAVAAEPGAEARFMVCPAGNRSMRLREARVEFHANGQLVHSVPTRTRTVRNRLAWLFLLLAIAVPCAIAWMRANPVQEFVPTPEALALANAAAANAAGKAGAPAVRVPPPPDAPVEKPDSSTGAEKKPDAPARPRGRMMQLESVALEADANARMPVGPGESLDVWIKKRGQRFWEPTFQLPLDAKEAFYAGLYVIKDGFPIAGGKRFPGLTQAYGFIMADPADQPLGPFQDMVIAAGLLLLALLCWMLLGPASRRLKGTVLEVTPMPA